MSHIVGNLESQNGYRIRWKIDDFKFLHESISAYKNSPQILESAQFKMWDCNWKFNLTLEKDNVYERINVKICLQVLDVESWDEKGLSISATIKANYKYGDDSKDLDLITPRLENYKITPNPGSGGALFAFTKIYQRIRRDFDFTWNILLVDFDDSSAQCKRHVSNAKRIKLMVNKWGLMLDDTVDHDVKIRCQGVEMSAHKVVLSGSSSVFKAMFQADMKETLESVVDVTVGTPEAVKLMLRWIYTGEIAEKEPKALDLLKLAHYYNLEGLMEECQLILVDKLCKENVIEMLNEADLLSAKMLKDSAIQFIIRNKSDFKVEDLATKLKPQLLAQLFLAQ